MDNPSHPDFRDRVWLLMLIAAITRAGTEIISKRSCHQLLFLSNALAPVYGTNPPDHLVMKYIRGPFYPKAQWDLDRMAIQGVVRPVNVESQKDKHGAWTYADYCLTRLGFDIVNQVTALPTVAPVWEFLQDLAIAYTNVQCELRNDAVLKDRTYDAPGVGNKAILSFEDDEDNRSIAAANTFVELAPQWLKPGRQDRLRMYLKYLELRVA